MRRRPVSHPRSQPDHQPPNTDPGHPHTGQQPNLTGNHPTKPPAGHPTPAREPPTRRLLDNHDSSDGHEAHKEPGPEQKVNNPHNPGTLRPKTPNPIAYPDSQKGSPPPS